LAWVVIWAPPASASRRQLTRYPYLTNVVFNGQRYNATVNWATDRSRSAAYVTFGRAGVERATAHRVNATKTRVNVSGVREYQWRATVSGLKSGARYAYRVFFDNPRLGLLGTDPSPVFRTPPKPGSRSTFSFAVTADWGTTSSDPYQHRLQAEIAGTGARFVLSAGDVAYPSGNEANYGDLFQTGNDVSAVFAPRYYKPIGKRMSMFGTPGNHGLNATFLTVWPEPTAAAASGGRYRMDTYRVPGTKTTRYPSVWYAFSAGRARFYVLTAAWPNANLGTGSLYSNDHAAHWKKTSAEYRWLAKDLARHRNKLKFALFHFPMYSDCSTEPTDTYLHGAGSLAALLTRYRVRFVFNGHAHVYERNFKQPGESFVSYVLGGGGESLEAIGAKVSSPFDAYGLGWSATTGTGSATGSASVPTSPAQVFSFALVTVTTTGVTVRPTNAQGESFDVVRYPY
ncbi:MAG TPA: metallophosphoesterase family protein, partial [Thermoleophilia bacterium]|nr:metallophosphoesterase family protein [Thermoleophilia bacterium]